MDRLRQRLAAVIDKNVDGKWEPLDVADAVIEELRITQATTGYNLAAHRYITGWIYG